MEPNIYQSLSICPLFQGIDMAEIEVILQDVSFKLVRYDKKDIYTLTGMPCKYADIVIKGELTTRMVSMSGKTVEVSRLNKGDIIAPAFIFAKDRTMPVSVETECETFILRFQPSEFETLIDHDIRLRRNFIQILSNIDVFLTKKMRVLSLFTVREKVAYFLTDTAKKQGSRTILLDKSRQEIAESFGIQKFSLLRCFSELVEQGAIEVNGKQITIIDEKKF
ncbi:MAG: Crp/Fnr family transcriptional regulator [Prevotella sp.]|nr:Crp/Fnr family transcriptional regulator [Prevotella sp.]